MKARFGLCAVFVVLAGCSDQDPSSRLSLQQSQAQIKGAPSAPRVTSGRSPSLSIASAPDRGALISYPKSSGAEQAGAYTFYPVALSEEHALRAIATGEMTVPTPTGEQVRLKYERHVEDADGNWTWIGRVDGGDQQQEAIITFGEKAVFGSIPQPNGQPPLRLSTRRGSLFAITTDASKVPNILEGVTDVLVPAAASGASAAAQAATAQSAPVSASASAAASPATTVDLAVGYTLGFAAALGGQSQAATRVSFLVQVGNQAFENSQINGAIRVVRAIQLNYADNTSNQSALEQVTGRNKNGGTVTIPPALAPLRAARDEYGADLAVVVRDFQTPENDGCGIAWLNGANQQPITQADAFYGYGVISDGSDAGTDGKTYFCADETLVHELAHLMGSAHDRDNSKKDDGSTLFGRYAYSFGQKTGSTAGNFFTIMAYGDNGQSFYRTFSNPLVLKCGSANNLACGVVNAADNARSLNQTLPIVAQFRATVVPIVGKGRNDFNNDGRSDILWRSDSKQIETWAMDGASLVTARGFQLPTGYRIMTSGDFNGDGYNDLLLTSAVRDLVLWIGSGSSFSSQSLNRTYGAEWSAVGQVDVNGDGKSDLLWRNNINGAIETWVMDGVTLSRATGFNLPTGYSVLTTGDFNGDGFVDLLLGGPSRELLAWFGTGTSFNGQSLGRTYGAGWVVTGNVDVNGDGKSDLLWRNDSANQFEAWIMDGFALTKATGYSLPAGYEIFGSGDYNGDGRMDLLLSNSQRELFMWFGDGTTFSGQAINRTYGAGWVADLDVRPFFAQKVTTDFNANGSSDILWKSDGTGQFETWMMAGGSLQRASGFALPAGYRIQATGDFNADGYNDLLLTSAARDTVMWLGNGVGFRGQSLNRIYGVGWSAIGNFEVNGDGRSDLLWHNSANGQFETWIMSGATLVQARGYTLPAGYRILTTGDFNGDGFTDLLLSSSSRDLVMWFGTGAGFNGQALNRQYGAGWAPAGLVDVDGDGKDDLVWRDTASNQFETWQMNGAQLNRATGFALPAGYGILGTGDYNGDGNTDLLIGNQARQIAMWFSTGSSFNGQSLNRAYGAGWNVLSSF
jgi:hypothetical protein